MTKVFIDGSVGTTGLRIKERLLAREDITCIVLPEDLRKDIAARHDAMKEADVTFLCLPDDAAREAVLLAKDCNTAIIDASTAHRTDPLWVYGFPELEGQREKIASSKRIANPGCHAGGFIALVAPLVRAGFLKKTANLTCFSLTGYSGGGKKMIADYESPQKDPLLQAPRQYGLTQRHKHIPEMMKVCGLEKAPAFCPVVGDFYSGMEVTVPLFGDDLKCTAEDIRDLYARIYNGAVVKFYGECHEEGFLSAGAFSGRDDMQITVCGSDQRILLVARFDNLGKGASGAAIQNMNVYLGIDETTGLCLGE